LECYKVVIIWVLHKRHSHQSVQRDSKMPTSPLRDPNHSLTVRQHFLTTHLPEYFSIFTDNESTDIREQFTYISFSHLTSSFLLIYYSERLGIEPREIYFI